MSRDYAESVGGRRRRLLSAASLGVLGLSGCFHQSPPANPGGSETADNGSPEVQPRRFHLSTEGSDKATALPGANKIITAADRTHVAYLASPSEGFRVRVRTYDRTKESWSPAYTVGEAADNHGSPALTIDSQGYLHIAYYPHHHPMRYKRSIRPHDASEWTEWTWVGSQTTYPALVCGADDTLYLACRESRPNKWRMDLYHKPPNGEWQGPDPVLQSRFDGYTQFQPSLAWGPDHEVLHLLDRVHEYPQSGAPAKPHYDVDETVVYLRSPDGGQTWQRSDGTRVDVPATTDSLEAIAEGGFHEDEPRVRLGNIVVDSDGTPYTLHHTKEDEQVETHLSWLLDGSWSSRPLSDELPSAVSESGLALPGSLTMHEDGRWAVAATAVETPADYWGGSSAEVVRITATRPGGDAPTESVLVSKPSETPHWHPNIEKPTGHNTIRDPAGIVYTAGEDAGSNSKLVSHDVYYVG